MTSRKNIRKFPMYLSLRASHAIETKLHTIIYSSLTNREPQHQTSNIAKRFSTSILPSRCAPLSTQIEMKRSHETPFDARLPSTPAMLGVQSQQNISRVSSRPPRRARRRFRSTGPAVRFHLCVPPAIENKTSGEKIDEPRIRSKRVSRAAAGQPIALDWMKWQFGPSLIKHCLFMTFGFIQPIGHRIVVYFCK